MIVRTAIVIAERSNVCVTQDISVPIVLKTHVKPQEPTAGLMVAVCLSTWEEPYQLLKKLVCVMQDGQVLLARRILVLVRHAADMELARREIQMQSVSVIHSISVRTVNSEKTHVWVNVPITT